MKELNMKKFLHFLCGFIFWYFFSFLCLCVWTHVTSDKEDEQCERLREYHESEGRNIHLFND